MPRPWDGSSDAPTFAEPDLLSVAPVPHVAEVAQLRHHQAHQVLRVELLGAGGRLDRVGAAVDGQAERQLAVDRVVELRQVDADVGQLAALDGDVQRHRLVRHVVQALLQVARQHLGHRAQVALQVLGERLGRHADLEVVGAVLRPEVGDLRVLGQRLLCAAPAVRRRSCAPGRWAARSQAGRQPEAAERGVVGPVVGPAAGRAVARGVVAEGLGELREGLGVDGDPAALGERLDRAEGRRQLVDRAQHAGDVGQARVAGGVQGRQALEVHLHVGLLVHGAQADQRLALGLARGARPPPRRTRCPCRRRSARRAPCRR